MNWYLLALKRYAEFSGRSRRKEYWYFTLFNVLAVFVLAFLAGLLSEIIGEVSLMVLGIYYLGVLIPSLAVTIRRLHDTGRSGWWLLIGLIPLIGSIVLIIFNVEDSKPGPNKWGPNPKEENHHDYSDPEILDELV